MTIKFIVHVTDDAHAHAHAVMRYAVQHCPRRHHTSHRPTEMCSSRAENNNSQIKIVCLYIKKKKKSIAKK